MAARRSLLAALVVAGTLFAGTAQAQPLFQPSAYRCVSAAKDSAAETQLVRSMLAKCLDTVTDPRESLRALEAYRFSIPPLYPRAIELAAMSGDYVKAHKLLNDMIMGRPYDRTEDDRRYKVAKQEAARVKAEEDRKALVRNCTNIAWWTPETSETWAPCKAAGVAHQTLEQKKRQWEEDRQRIEARSRALGTGN